jgi:hypothetical protein
MGARMNRSGRLRIVVLLTSLMSGVGLAAHAQDSGHPRPTTVPPSASAPVQRAPVAGGRSAAAAAPRSGPDARFIRGAPTARAYAGAPYRGRVAWETGRWRHEIHNGRDGWWWDVGGVWYYYPQRLEGAPTYISEEYADDIPIAAYGPPQAAYEAAPPPPPPAPPPPDPGASAVGGAIVGGLLGGLLTGRVEGAAVGAVAGGATGAIAGATAASRPGYYVAEGRCYYRYPSGQYVLADPRWCY